MLPDSMLSMAADPGRRRLVARTVPLPVPQGREVLVKVLACGVCRTDLHVVDGDLPPHRTPVVPGHEVVGRVVARGAMARRFAPGERIGIPWLGGACGTCPYCAARRENLCDAPVFMGCDRDGGFAEYAAADEDYCLALPAAFDDAHAAPLLCAGLIGFRAWRLAGGAQAPRLGLYGFGAAAHIVCQLAVAAGQEVLAFTRPGDARAQAFARALGASWSGGSAEAPPRLLDAALIFAPDGALVPAALAATRKGGSVVCAGIHMSTIPAFEYGLLWGERSLRSVANLTRADGEEFMAQIAATPVRTHVSTFPLRSANEALDALRAGLLEGAAVLVP